MINETVRHPGLRLGRRPPKDAPALALGTYLTGTVPEHPATADHFAKVADWGLYENNKFGDCGPTSVANQRKLVTRYLTDTEVSPSQDDVFDLYKRSGNPDFDPNTGAGDNGVDMQTMLEAVLSGGIGGTKCVAFAKVDVGDLEQVRAAIAIFGSLLFGVDLEISQQAQTDSGTWDYQKSGEWGGHAIVSGQYADTTGVITWAQVVKCTEAFLTHQLDEAWAVIWPEHLGSRQFLDGIDTKALAADYKTLTGRDFPA